MSELSDDELLRLWLEAGGDFHTGSPALRVALMIEDHLLRFLRSFAVHVRAEGLEAAAHWHDEQAAMHRDLAATAREDWTDLKSAYEHDTDAWRHKHYARIIRGLAAGAPASEE
jgi:hypothetical protein